jgi:hypothetical protein
METRLYTAPEMILCTCSHQLILVTGAHCEVCMGVVTEQEVLDNHEEQAGQYDLSYFEALERMFESFEFAA